MENSIGDEESRKDIDRVVHVSQKNNGGKSQREEQENIADDFIFPKNKSQKKWQAGMSGEKQIISRENAIKNFFVKKNRIYYDVSWEWTDMCDTYKD